MIIPSISCKQNVKKGITKMRTIEGVTNPQIINHSCYESCRFIDVSIGFDFENPSFEGITFEHCEFINCTISRALWYKCDWVSSYILNINMTKTIFAKCKMQGLIGYSDINETIAIDSNINLQQVKSKIDITYF